MPRDLFEEAGIVPVKSSGTAPRDLFAEAGIKPDLKDIALRQLADETPWYQKALIGAGRRVDEYATGAQQLLGLPGAASAKQALDADKAAFEKLGGWATAGAGGVDLAASLLPGGLLGAATKGIGVISNAPKLMRAGQAVMDAGAASQSVGMGARMAGGGLSTGAAQSVLAADDANNLMGNFAMGAASGAGIPLLAAGAGKAINAVRGRWADPAAKALDDAARARGVNLTAGDLKPDGIMAGLENRIDGVFGSGRRATLKNQSNQVQSMLADTVDGFKPASIASGAADDAGQVISNSLNMQYAANRTQAGKLYDVVQNQAAFTNSKIAPTQLKKATADLLDEYPDLLSNLEASPKLIGKLQSLSQGLADQPSAILNANGQSARTIAADLSFQDARWLRQQLGTLVGQAQKREITGGSPAATGKLKTLFGSLAQDMDAWGANTSNKSLSTAYKEANAYFIGNVQPFRDNPAIRKIITGAADSDTVAQSLLKPGRGNLASDAMALMTPEGQQAAKYELVKRAADKALDPNLESGLSAKAWLSKMNLGNTANKVFTADELASLESVNQILRAAKNAPRAMADPLTGNRAVPFLTSGGAGALGFMGGGLPGALGASAGLSLGARGINALSSSRVGKGLLFADDAIPLGDGINAIRGLLSTRD